MAESMAEQGGPRCNKVRSDLFTYEQFVELGAVMRKWNVKVPAR